MLHPAAALQWCLDQLSAASMIAGGPVSVDSDGLLAATGSGY
jgi:hypothetical protein